MNRRRMASIMSIFLVGLFWHSASAAGGWGYEGAIGPAEWYKTYSICKDDSQSPINIFEGDATANGVTEDFVFKNYEITSGLTMTVKNNGYGAVINMGGSNIPEISGGGLGGEYQAAQFHLHWSSDFKSGSEHLISSESFPAELHIVHFKKSYGNLTNAMTKADGLAVLGFMYEISATGNSNYNSLISSISRIISPDSTPVALAAETLKSYLPSTFSKFYRYSGSLTTPPCYETVAWTVYKEPIKISRSQLGTFLEMIDDQDVNILHNARPVQPINGREILSNYDSKIEWSYYPGQYPAEEWPKYYEACGGTAQSPVNIPSQASTLDNSLANFNFNGFDSTAGYTMKLANVGHTLKVSLSGTEPFVTGGSLPGTYNVAQFHFHWGASSMRGSEHTVDSKMYPMEVHFVMYKSSLGSLGAAVKIPEGLAVLGFFFELSDNDNPNLKPIIDLLSNINLPGTDVALNPITLDSIIPADRSKYYRYPGSLTTPGCYESVIWSVFDSKISISEAQLAELRKLKAKKKVNQPNTYWPLVDNYRPVQFLNSRTIRRNFGVAPPPKKTWTYFGATGAQQWSKMFATCGKDRQSPIDIQPRTAEFKQIPEFEFKNFRSTSGISLKLKNNGYAATVNYEAGDLQVSQGGLHDNYKVAQYHFHWGSVNSKGQNIRLMANVPMELHIVTYNMLYDNINVAVTQGNGLAVLGFMFQISDEDNPKLEPLVSHLSKIENPNTEVALPTFSLDSIMPRDRKQFFRYDGSLTTPTCDESVTWTVFYSTIPISENQLIKFRDLYSSELDDRNNTRPLVDNYRPVQDLKGRTVYSNFYISSAPSSRATAPAVASVIFTIGKLAWGFN